MTDISTKINLDSRYVSKVARFAENKNMKHSLTVLYVFIWTTGAPTLSRIYGGQNSTSGQFPFMVALNDDNQFCNGAIIAPSWILTLAYCISYVSPNAEVYVGSHINHVNGTGYRLFERVMHGQYEEPTTKNDIALIRINTVLEYGDTVQAVELGVAPRPNSTCTMMGWGVAETEDYPSSLQYVDTTAIDLATCQAISANSSNEFYLGPEQICTQNNVGQGACNYDYGGALLCDGKLSGILSYSVGWCGVGMPDVFTSVEAYTDWILSYVQL